MKEATLTSTANVEKSTKNVDYSSILPNVVNIGKIVFNFLTGENFALAVGFLFGITGFFMSVLEHPKAPWLLAIASIASIRGLISITEGGKDE